MTEHSQLRKHLQDIFLGREKSNLDWRTERKLEKTKEPLIKLGSLIKSRWAERAKATAYDTVTTSSSVRITPDGQSLHA